MHQAAFAINSERCHLFFSRSRLSIVQKECAQAPTRDLGKHPINHSVFIPAAAWNLSLRYAAGSTISVLFCHCTPETMMKPNRSLFVLFILGAILSFHAPTHAQSAPVSRESLREGFLHPPQPAKLRCYWWWLNGNTTEATITRDLTEMSRKGIGGVLLVDANGSNQNGNENSPAGPLFGSPEWTKLYLHALKTAAALHLEVTLNITSGWNLGGPDVKPEEASKLLTWSRTSITAGAYDGTLPTPPSKNGFYRQIAVLAYPLAHGAPLPGKSGDLRRPISNLAFKTASRETGFSMPPSEPLLADAPASANEEDTHMDNVVNISGNVDASGHLHWQPPTGGAWEILRIGYTDSDARVSTSSGAWQGLAIDYLDRRAFDTYWEHSVAPLLDAARPYLKSTLISLATDSWEVGGTNWTDRFAAEFRRRRGYDPLPYLPVVTGRIVENRAASNRFLNDLRRTVGDLITDHYDHFAERAAEYGLLMQCESGGPHGAPVDALETFRAAGIPQTEYWAQSKEHRSRDEERFFTKEVASAADIYGKKFAADEGMTSIGPHWSESLATDLKPSFDQALTEGMTRLVWHEFTSSPESTGLPGNEYFAGTHINPKITWWEQSADFFLYINRAQFLLQQGHAVDDVLYFYGDQVPNFVRLKRDDPAHVLPGYDYDVTNEDALLRTLSLHPGGLATPAGNEYRLLVLPASHRISLAALERIAEYVRQGGNIVGEPPLGATGIIDEPSARRFSTLKTELWGSCAQTSHPYGAGRVFCNEDSRAALRELKISPDFAESTGKLDYVHRRDGSTEIYFVRNGTSQAIDSNVSFRAGGRQPELWNAVDGSTNPLTHYRAEEGMTSFPLHLAPYASVFVVFAQPVSKEDAWKAAQQPLHASSSTTLDLPARQWTITFQKDRGAPQGSLPLGAFTSWTTWPDAGVRYFSGTATYSTEIDGKHGSADRVFVALTELHEICTVLINGKTVGTIWAMPYELDITDSLRDGPNRIELQVTNLWPNRLIGDAQPGVLRPFTHTNIRKYKRDSPLLLSGLIGPVALRTIHSSPADDVRNAAEKR
jgi:hypothetical protein